MKEVISQSIKLIQDGGFSSFPSLSHFLTATALMSETWPVKDCLHMPSRMSHSLEVASQAPDTKVL